MRADLAIAARFEKFWRIVSFIVGFWATQKRLLLVLAVPLATGMEV